MVARKSHAFKVGSLAFGIAFGFDVFRKFPYDQDLRNYFLAPGKAFSSRADGREWGQSKRIYPMHSLEDPPACLVCFVRAWLADGPPERVHASLKEASWEARPAGVG